MTLWWLFHCLKLWKGQVALLYHWYRRRQGCIDWIKENHLFGVQQVFNCSSSMTGVVVPPTGVVTIQICTDDVVLAIKCFHHVLDFHQGGFYIFDWGGVRRDDRAWLPIKNYLYRNDVVEWREKSGFKGAGENDGSFSILRGPALPLLWYALDLVLFYTSLLSQDYVDLVLWHDLTFRAVILTALF
ncbi:hypothetical protein AVEN_75413-1 [Araneus ventricosus]|uniref:Uncharacterized protein n=1 Tax=Araneus ventricosus TaxID=182803 RepID=A0A4Y2J7B0_ARAVE|nr:hypothetical protein AVEN_75413-1 [Araneus ventricosus]